MTSTARFSLCQLAVPDTTFEEDVALAQHPGIGLSIATDKLGAPEDDDRLIALMRDSGVEAAVCVAQPMTILPSDYVPEPLDLRERMDGIVAGIRRLARFDPSTVFVITGPERELGAERAREIVVESLRELQGVARESGVLLSLEPMREENRDSWNLLCSMAETLDMIEEVGGELGIVYDMWHLWNTPDILPMSEKHGSLVTGVHVCDHREPTRSAVDRVLPGDGTIDMPAMIRALEKGGFTGWWDLEIFSDPEFPDSIWRREPSDWVADGKQKFDRIYAESHAATAS
jgi:sugar phosphate isomerase/epimerase